MLILLLGFEILTLDSPAKGYISAFGCIQSSFTKDFAGESLLNTKNRGLLVWPLVISAIDNEL